MCSGGRLFLPRTALESAKTALIGHRRAKIFLATSQPELTPSVTSVVVPPNLLVDLDVNPMKIDSREVGSVPTVPPRSCSRSLRKLLKIFFLVPSLRLIGVTVTEQLLTNIAAHKLAVHVERDLEVAQKMISKFGNKEIILVSS